jgi:hypothetical protein
MISLSAKIEDVRAAYRLLAHAGRGVTEVRVIHPGRGIAGIGFFDDEDAFVSACAEHSGKANVYAGIQPRPSRFLADASNRVAPLNHGAKDDDIEWLTSIVVDLDPVRPKDTASTDAELALAVERAEAAAAWIESKGFSRPVRIMSGNGCHLWFAVPPHEIHEDNRGDLTRRLRAFESRLRERFSDDAVKVDSIYNLSRVIKVVGTPSVKGEDLPERPHRLSCGIDPLERREDGKLLQAILSMPAEERETEALDEQSAPSAAHDGLDPWVHALISSSDRLAALFEGRGKTAVTPDGKRVDTTSSGYDFSIIHTLVKRGVTDPDQLATVLWHRPDGAARAKGQEYIARTVRRAIEIAHRTGGKQKVDRAGPADRDGGEEPAPDIDFIVTKLVVSDSVPPVYQLHVDDHVLVLTVDDLLSPRHFEKRFVAQLRRIPHLPGKGAAMSWKDLVNGWLAAAEVIHQPPEASPRGLLKEEIARVIDNLGEAETPADLDRGKTFRVDGRRGFKTRTVLRALREAAGGDAGTHDVCNLLRELGCENTLCRLDGARVRLWLAPASWTEPPAADGEPSPTPEDPAPEPAAEEDA